MNHLYNFVDIFIVDVDVQLMVLKLKESISPLSVELRFNLLLNPSLYLILIEMINYSFSFWFLINHH